MGGMRVCIYRSARENSYLSRQLMAIITHILKEREREREKERGEREEKRESPETERLRPWKLIYILMPPHISLRAHIRHNRFSNISVICTRVIIGYAHYRRLIIASSQRTYTRQLCNNCKTVFCIVRSRRYYYRSDAFMSTLLRAKSLSFNSTFL